MYLVDFKNFTLLDMDYSLNSIRHIPLDIYQGTKNKFATIFSLRSIVYLAVFQRSAGHYLKGNDKLDVIKFYKTFELVQEAQIADGFSIRGSYLQAQPFYK